MCQTLQSKILDELRVYVVSLLMIFETMVLPKKWNRRLLIGMTLAVLLLGKW